MIVATMASVITSVTAFVSTMSTASASRTRPPTPINKERFNVLAATTRLRRPSLQSVGSQIQRSFVRSRFSTGHSAVGRHRRGPARTEHRRQRDC